MLAKLWLVLNLCCIPIAILACTGTELLFLVGIMLVQYFALFAQRYCQKDFKFQKVDK